MSELTTESTKIAACLKELEEKIVHEVANASEDGYVEGYTQGYEDGRAYVYALECLKKRPFD